MEFVDVCDNSCLELNVTRIKEMVRTFSIKRTWFHHHIFGGVLKFSSTLDETL